MQNYSNKYTVKNFSVKKDDFESRAGKILPIVVLLFFLFGKKDETIARVAKKIILENGAIQRIPSMDSDLDGEERAGSLAFTKSAVADLTKLEEDESENSGRPTVPVFTLRRPFTLPELREAKFEGKDLMVKLKLSNVHIVDIGAFISKEIADEGLLAVDLDIESVTLYVQYNMNGNIHGQAFNHIGRTDVLLADVTGKVLVEHAPMNDLSDNGIVEISKLNLNFDFKTLEFGRTGLSLKRVPAVELRRLFNSLGRKYFKQNLKKISAQLSETLKTQTTSLLANKTRDQLFNFLLKHLQILNRLSGRSTTLSDLRDSEK